MSSLPEPLFEFLAGQHVENFEINPQVDSRRHLARRFNPEFPMLLKLYNFPSYRRMVGHDWMHWHEYLELILPVCGQGRFQIGDQTVEFTPGDLLIVDNLKLHGVSQVSGPHRSLVIFFPFEAVTPPGSGGPDEAFLAPLCGRPEDRVPILRCDAPAAPKIHAALLSLAQNWFSSAPAVERFLECKICLLSILASLRSHFGVREGFQEQVGLRLQRQMRLQNLFTWLGEHYSEEISQPQAAAIAGMSASRLRDFFKQTTGCTFVDYLRNLRLRHAAQMLRETEYSIAEIAAATGFSDQSYLHRCFAARYDCAPSEYRKGQPGRARELTPV